MFNAKIIVIVCTICVISDTAFVDSIGKCSIKDDTCLKKSFQKVISSIGDDGIPELGIPSINPLLLKDVKVSILGMVDITLIEGKATGLQSCHFSKYTSDIEKGKGSQENICDIIIEGKYKLFSDSPLVKSLFGGSTIHGEGNGKIELEKIRVSFDFPLSAIKKDDGEIYLKSDFKKVEYDFEVLKRVKFTADNLYLGEQEASKVIVNLLNDNWKLIMSAYGHAFLDKALQLYFDLIGKFFDTVPVKHFITDDLTPYVKK